MSAIAPAGESEIAPSRTVGVCLASYNRRETTLRCLRDLFGAQLPAGVALAVYLVDDASTDGTAEAVAASFPAVTLMRGAGNLYWGGAMRQALGRAMETGHDFYLWLNDDIEIFPDALAKAIATHDALALTGEQAIVVGATRDHQGVTTYSGMRRFGANPVGFRKIEPDADAPTRCDTSNGNFVLIPAAAALAVGNIDPRFTHRIGDVDYVLRARQHGFSCWICPGHVAFCDRNEMAVAWQTRGYSLRRRWQMLTSPLGLPPREWLVYGYRHGGLLGVTAALLNYRWLLFPRFSQ